MFFFQLCNVVSLRDSTVNCCSVNFSCLQHKLIVTTLVFSHQSVLYVSECQLSVVIQCISNYSDVEHGYFIVCSSSGNWFVKSKTKMILILHRLLSPDKDRILSRKLISFEDLSLIWNFRLLAGKKICKRTTKDGKNFANIGQYQAVFTPKLVNNKMLTRASSVNRLQNWCCFQFPEFSLFYLNTRQTSTLRCFPSLSSILPLHMYIDCIIQWYYSLRREELDSSVSKKISRMPVLFSSSLQRIHGSVCSVAWNVLSWIYAFRLQRS